MKATQQTGITTGAVVVKNGVYMKVLFPSGFNEKIGMDDIEHEYRAKDLEFL